MSKTEVFFSIDKCECNLGDAFHHFPATLKPLLLFLSLMINLSTLTSNWILFSLKHQYPIIYVFVRHGAITAFSFAVWNNFFFSQTDSGNNLITARVSIRVQFEQTHMGGVVGALCKVL